MIVETHHVEEVAADRRVACRRRIDDTDPRTGQDIQIGQERALQRFNRRAHPIDARDHARAREDEQNARRAEDDDQRQPGEERFVDPPPDLVLREREPAPQEVVQLIHVGPQVIDVNFPVPLAVDGIRRGGVGYQRPGNLRIPPTME